jgi:hypothetical protein
MTIPDALFTDMESRNLPPHARLLLLDCIRRANRQYPSPIEDLKTKRALRVAYRDGRLGMSRMAFVKARKQLIATGFLSRRRDENSGRLNRDWFWLQAA